MITVTGKYYLKADNVKVLCHDKCISTLCMEPVRTTMVQFIKYIKISLNNTISFTLRLTMHSQVNKFVVKAFFGKGKKKKA